MTVTVTVGVLALQGAFYEHTKLLKAAASQLQHYGENEEVVVIWNILEIRTAHELDRCDALIIPGGESTTVSLVAARSGLLEPLRDFVKVHRKPTWGTCAGLILLAESANRMKKGGQDLIGGLDVRVNRNYFGRQTESFEAELDLPFLSSDGSSSSSSSKGDVKAFRGVFIRAPIVEKILPSVAGEQRDEAGRDGTVVAPPGKKEAGDDGGHTAWPVEIMATLPGRCVRLVVDKIDIAGLNEEVGDIVAVKQRNVFGTSFHPELTADARIHVWWLRQVLDVVRDQPPSFGGSETEVNGIKSF
ncbi:MAG: hypothetical protein Q9219_006873 [cf. Caloplaca sp. 3 TL-2023]